MAAARELLIRRRARTDICDYARAIDIPGKPVTDDPDSEAFLPVETVMATHHRLILQTMDRISRTDYGRVMFFVPPGAGKSTYASVVFPSNYLGREPDRRLILASYGDDLARKMGRRTRSILRQSRYRGIFGTGLRSDSQAVQEFALENGSEYMAAGILSGVTGNRCHGLIIDDPVKGREAAESETISAKTWDAYQDDLKTRLVPRGWIAIIQTRWSRNDLAGRILPEDWNGQSGIIRCRDGFDWEIVCLQARCEVDDDPLGRKQGEYLWPEWFDRKHWAQFEPAPRTWAALFQQRPAPTEGVMFRPNMLRIVEAIPSNVVEVVRGWDLGSTVEGDHSVGAKIGKLSGGGFIILDVERFRESVEVRDTAILNIAGRDGYSVKTSLPEDPGSAGKSQVFYLTQQLAGYRITSSRETGSKAVRAEGFAAQVNVGNVMMLRGPWNAALIEEMRYFTGASDGQDDQIDALSRAFSELIGQEMGYIDDLALANA